MKQLTSEQLERLSKLYAEGDLALDRLPYTPQFERLFAAFVTENHVTLSRSDIWHVLVNLRKRSRLTRKGRGE